MNLRSRRSTIMGLLLTGALLATLFPGSAGAGHRRELRFMTRNLYLGAPLTPIFTAAATGDPNALVGAASTAWAQIQASNFPARAEELADEIGSEQPDLVGLQEVTLYRTGTFLDPAPATDVELDFLATLKSELAERDLPYRVVTQVSAFDGELPVVSATEGPIDVRLTDRDVILARTDLPTSLMKLSKPDSGLFDAKLEIPSPLFPGGALPILRGWASVDVKSRGKSFRLINTHLEAFSDTAQEAQSVELLEGPADTNKPVVMTGDFNSPADGTGSDSYGNIVDPAVGGFTDAWGDVFPADPGFTCCHSDDLMSAAGDLDSRIDLIFFRGRGFDAIEAEIVGEEETDKTPGGLWPSDHAGVLSTLTFGPTAGH